MTSIGELFPKCRKLAYDARLHVAALQVSSSSDRSTVAHGGSLAKTATTPTASADDLFLTLEELERQLSVMDQLVLRELPDKRPVRIAEIAELRAECARLQQEGHVAVTARQQAERWNQHHHHNSTNYQNERDELMLRRRRRLRQGNVGSEEEDQQNLADEGRSLDQSNVIVLNILQQGQASLGNLHDQRHRLRGVRGVLVDIGQRLGLSQSTLRMIERRDITDANLVAAGMIVTCIVIYVVWFWL